MSKAGANNTIIGSQLGDYQVRSLLGSGGMAEVYKGYDAALDREVAIKIIRLADQPDDFIARFRREARVVASLRHPNVVQIYQFGEQDGVIYMVQELLPGPTLAQRIRRAGKKGVAFSRIHTTMEQLARALDYAHGQGVTHRDVKPGNALYNTHDELVLTDFGIARTTADTSRTATKSGIIVGTPGYIAPEQAISSASITSACDIYSLGVVLFELLTGRLPFDADAPMEMVLKHLYDDPPPPSTFRADLPAQVDKVVFRAMDKDPEKRYPSAGALTQAFQAACPRDTADASTATTRKTTGTGSSQRGKSSPTRKPTTTATRKGQQSKPASKQARSPERKSASASKSDTPKARQSGKSATQGKSGGATSTPRKTSAAPSRKNTRTTAPSPPTRARWPRIALLLVCLVGVAVLVGLELQAQMVSDTAQQLWSTYGP